MFLRFEVTSIFLSFFGCDVYTVFSVGSERVLDAHQAVLSSPEQGHMTRINLACSVPPCNVPEPCFEVHPSFI